MELEIVRERGRKRETYRGTQRDRGREWKKEG